jgi:hypothetical protein
MSRKNRNARRASAAPSNIGSQIGQNTALRMCTDTCGYEYRQLMSNVLFTDTSYQRSIDAARVKKIVENFDPRIANTLKVSLRDGCFYVFDGAHTLLALKKVHGETTFPVDCKVFFGLNYEDEAYLFALQNGASKEVAFSARLRAMLISRSAEAEDFRAHTANVGLSLAEGTGSATRNTIAALAKAYKLYTDRGAEEYERLLRLIVDTWGGAAWSLTGYILGGVSVLFEEYGEALSRDRFIKKLRGTTYESLRDEARRQQRSSSDIAHALALLKVYNIGGRGALDTRALMMRD